jgi:hypothetical protein
MNNNNRNEIEFIIREAYNYKSFLTPTNNLKSQAILECESENNNFCASRAFDLCAI